MNTIDVTRASNGGLIIKVNGTARTISNPQNVVAKLRYGVIESTGQTGITGIVIKLSDESWRCRVGFDDTFSLGGVTVLGQVSDWPSLVNQLIAGSSTYAAAKINQTITFAQPAPRVHTAPAFSANASTTSGLALAYVSSDPTKATVGAASGIITPVAAGTTDITVSQAGDANYNAASPIIRTITLT